MVFALSLYVLVTAAPTPACSLEVLLDYTGDVQQPLYTVLGKSGFEPAHTGKLKSPHVRSELYFGPKCAESAKSLGKTLGLAADAVQPLSWKSQYGLTLAVSRAETERLEAAAKTGDVAKIKAALLPTAEWRGVLRGAMEKPKPPNLPIIALLIDNGLPPETAYDEHPLKTAAGDGNLELCKLLLDRGVKAEQESASGPPLADAAKEGQLATARLLLDRGARAFAESWSWWNPLWVASTPEMAELLLARGAHATDSIREGQTALHFNDTAGVDAVLVAHGAKVDARDGDGWTPLHNAANRLVPDKVAFLLSKGADPNARTTRSVRDIAQDGESEIVYPVGMTPLDFIGDDTSDEKAEQIAKALVAAGGKRHIAPRPPCDSASLDLVGVAQSGAFLLRSKCAVEKDAPAGKKCAPCDYPRVDGHCHAGLSYSLHEPGRMDGSAFEIWADAHEPSQCTADADGKQALAAAEAAFKAKGVSISAAIPRLACTGEWPTVRCPLPAGALKPFGVDAAAAVTFTGVSPDEEGAMGMAFTLALEAKGVGSVVLDTAECMQFCNTVTMGSAWLSPDASLLVVKDGQKAFRTQELAAKLLQSQVRQP